MKKGFTLIELMIVIAIIAILAAIAVPSFAKMREKAAVQSAARSIEGLKYAMEVYQQEPDNNGNFPTITGINAATDTWNGPGYTIDMDIKPSKLAGTLRTLSVWGNASAFRILARPKVKDPTGQTIYVWVTDTMNNAAHNYPSGTATPADPPAGTSEVQIITTN